jgi:hypothetical protein
VGFAAAIAIIPAINRSVCSIASRICCSFAVLISDSDDIICNGVRALDDATRDDDDDDDDMSGVVGIDAVDGNGDATLVTACDAAVIDGVDTKRFRLVDNGTDTDTDADAATDTVGVIIVDGMDGVAMFEPLLPTRGARNVVDDDNGGDDDIDVMGRDKPRTRGRIVGVVGL